MGDVTCLAQRAADSLPGGAQRGTDPPPARRSADRAQAQETSSPQFDKLVVVEGLNDMRAVRRAVKADVFVLGTATHAGDDDIMRQLRSAAAHLNGVVVLTDPDVAGRQARNILDVKLGGCLHAFVSVGRAQALTAVRRKDAGDIGVEHASPSAIRHALASLHRSDESRKTFTREALQDIGLIAVKQEMVGASHAPACCLLLAASVE